MNLLLHTPESKGELSRYYERAFKNSVEIFVVTAFLTDWDASLKLNPDCRSFRVIIGKDFGITRKAACEKVMHWLPAKRESAIPGCRPDCRLSPQSGLLERVGWALFCHRRLFQSDPSSIRNKL